MIHINKIKAAKGFSLLELVVTLTVVLTLSTLTWMSGPSLLAAGRLRAGTDTIHNNLSWARQTALSSSKPCVLVIRTTGEHAWKFLSVFSLDLVTSEWTQIGAWQALPTQVQIDETFLPSWLNTVGLPSLLNSVAAPITPISQDGTELVHDTDYISIGFRPDGSMVTNENIALKVISNPGSTTASANTANWMIVLAERAGGRVKVFQPGLH